jgi:hypothetical protein
MRLKHPDRTQMIKNNSSSKMCEKNLWWNGYWDYLGNICLRPTDG